MTSLIRPALSLFVLMSALLGLAYPWFTTQVGRTLFPAQAEGSLIRSADRVVGSALIGQAFTDPRYFWGRPSATSPMPDNAQASSGSNFGPLNPALAASAADRAKALRDADPGNTAPIPSELVTASASGLDPHISPAAAYYQAARVARQRGWPRERVDALIGQSIESPDWGLFGEPRVNVLQLNLALDRAARG